MRLALASCAAFGAALGLTSCSVDHPVLLPHGDGGAVPARDSSFDARREEGLLEPMIVYRFDEGAGDRALDSSGSGMLVHLRVQDPAAVTWIPGGLRIDAPTVVSSDLPARELVEVVHQTQSFTVEAWIRPAETVVGGTRRIITLSVDPSRRNFLLGQGALFADTPIDAYVLRLRTTETDSNGLPMLETGAGTAVSALTHLVAVHAPDGSESIYADGALVTTGARPGNLTSWDPDYRIAVGNEHGDTGGSRSWLGELHFIALYPAPMSADDVRRHFAAGADR
jgi:hypothetical protein